MEEPLKASSLEVDDGGGHGMGGCIGGAGSAVHEPTPTPPPPVDARPLDVSVRRRKVVLAPGMEFPTTRNWPATTTVMKLEKLTIRLDVEVGWTALGRREDVVLSLAPQSGARVALGGLLEDAEHWVPLMLTGEQTVSVLDENSSDTSSEHGPRANVLRAMCQHGWEEEPATEEDDDLNGEDGALVPGVDTTVTGGKGVTDAAVCLIGFALRARLNVTATLYLAPATFTGGSTGRRHTLLVSGAGTLELRPRLVDFRRLGLQRLMAAAQEDTKRGENSAALQKWRHALPLQERRARFGGAREATKLSSLLHSMGVCCNLLNDPREALSCLRRALAIRQHVLGEEHPESARTLQALGVVRVRDGEYHEAFEYFWQALRYYEAFEPESLDAGSTLQAIAGVYGKLGEFSEALECYVRALTIREQELGKDHLEVAATLHNLGVVLEKLSDHTEALESLHRALAIRERRLGPSHPQTARTLHSIGIVYSQILDYTSALAFYQRALTICQKRPGEDTHAAATLNNMGVVYAKLGHTELALQHHQQAYAIQERVLGAAHCDTVATKYNLQVLQAEIEQNANRTVFDQVKTFFSMALAPEPRSPSLVALLCEESGEADGPVDEPFCSTVACSPGCGLGRRGGFQDTQMAQLQSEMGGTPVFGGDNRADGLGSSNARLGFPEPRRRGRGYPAAADPTAQQRPHRDELNHRPRQPCGDRRSDAPNAPSDGDLGRSGERRTGTGGLAGADTSVLGQSVCGKVSL
eukprot:TRINITY_DN11094_c0_g1_i4.p1 TRINITY_DN11094_c0_g1~~TRINITY_DN11094_c0_g1_i4.p1  ORF type:complete len:773 (+),score=110.11 TRINITY_DN11094_c0_g1_i4:58-2319(+)